VRLCALAALAPVACSHRLPQPEAPTLAANDATGDDEAPIRLRRRNGAPLIRKRAATLECTARKGGDEHGGAKRRDPFALSLASRIERRGP
jgi:hypothetical protein